MLHLRPTGHSVSLCGFSCGIVVRNRRREKRLKDMFFSGLQLVTAFLLVLPIDPVPGLAYYRDCSFQIVLLDHQVVRVVGRYYEHEDVRLC